jgi:glycosyltransferase involved in cell wall biosynthesis
MKKVLLITDVNFWERCSGHRARISELIDYLALKVELSVVKVGPVSQAIEAFVRTSINAEFYVLEKTKMLNSNGYGRRLMGYLKDRHFDVIIIEYIHCSYFLNFLVKDVYVLLDAHDIISHRTGEFAKYHYAGKESDTVYKMTRENEINLFNIYDNVIVLCQPDLEKINEMIGIGKAILCPHPAAPCRHEVRPDVKIISFVASSYLPNIDAINWFIANCWPRILCKYPVQLKIYGTICSELRSIELAGVSLNGYVPDPSIIYEEADIIINPVRFGAGLKIKNIEALSHGLPLITTTHGARGIESGIDDCFLVANDEDDFFDSIESLIQSADLRKKIGKNALKFIERNYSAEKCFAPLLEVINYKSNL